MKRIQAIIRPAVLEEIKEALLAMDNKGMTINQVMGCGNQQGWTEYYRGSINHMNMLPKIEVSIVTDEDKVDKIIDAIIKVARTGDAGDGKIFVTNVERVIRIRTGEEGSNAL